MPELSEPATIRARQFRIITAPWSVSRSLRITLPPAEFVGRSGRDASDGFEEAPSIRLGTLGHFRFRLAISAGPRTVSVHARQPVSNQPRPRLVVRANHEIGLNQDLAQNAPGGSDWVKIGPLSFTAADTGGVYVELWNPSVGWPCWFDNVAVT